MTFAAHRFDTALDFLKMLASSSEMVIILFPFQTLLRLLKYIYLFNERL